MQYSQKTSIIKRLGILIAVSALFFLVAYFGIYWSSQSFLRGISTINLANDIMTSSTLAMESAEVAMKSVENTLQAEKIADAKITFAAASNQAVEQLAKSIAEAKPFPALEPHLVPVNLSLSAFVRKGNEFFATYTDANKRAHLDQINRDLLIMSQHKLDLVEGLRKAQIELKDLSSSTFATVYDKRHQPLYVGIILMLVFFLVVGTAGYLLLRQLYESIRNLLNATTIVGQGNLEHRAVIQSADEIGVLTYHFNAMVTKLQKSKDRTLRLQAITAAFSEALNPEQVLSIVVERGFPALGADTGLIALLSPEIQGFEVIKAHGFTEADIEQWREIPFNSKRPLTDALNESKPIWIHSAAELATLYPDVPQIGTYETSALVVLPLIVQGKAIGAMCLNFRAERDFPDEEKEYMTSLAQLCAQALYRSQLHLETQQALILRDEFLSIASHELKTPLTPLMLQVQQINRLLLHDKLEKIPAEQLKTMLDIAHAQVVRLSKLIEQLLDVARISTGRLAIEKVPTDLSKLTHEVIEQFKSQIQAANCELKLDIKPNVTGLWDPLRIEQIITNLLSNAIRYSKGRLIDIQISDDADTATITVKDHGQGIEAKDQERIFGRFERAASAKHYGGLGLGLYITKQIVDRHQGKISVRSNVGEGATFFVSLPKQSSDPLSVSTG